MGARHKLNELYAIGSALVAAFFGLAAESWQVFLGVLVALLALMVHGGDIRLQQLSQPQPVSTRRGGSRATRSRRRR